MPIQPVVEEIEARGPEPLPHHSAAHSYSLGRAVRFLADPARRGRALPGLEGEVSAEIALRSGRNPQGFFVPLDVQCRAFNLAAGAGGLANIVQREWVDVLRAKLLTTRFGATLLTDLY